MLIQWVGRIRRLRAPLPVPILCLDCSDNDGPFFIAHVIGVDPNEDRRGRICCIADNAISAQLELLGRIGAQ